MTSDRRLPYELRLAYITILLFIVAQYVVDEKPWNQIFRICGLLAFLGSMVLAARKRS